MSADNGSRSVMREIDRFTQCIEATPMSGIGPVTGADAALVSVYHPQADHHGFPYPAGVDDFLQADCAPCSEGRGMAVDAASLTTAVSWCASLAAHCNAGLGLSPASHPDEDFHAALLALVVAVHVGPRRPIEGLDLCETSLAGPKLGLGSSGMKRRFQGGTARHRFMLQFLHRTIALNALVLDSDRGLRRGPLPRHGLRETLKQV
ncbi:hypothetical protein QF036_004912 [Arthrobacter globiformis]|nr:hypothetical protein [Arthrobacter globiformis]